jgi:hypothetical protein
MGGDFGELTAEWGGTFDGDESEMSFAGEYDGVIEGIVVEFSGVPLTPFDVTYTGGFTTNRTGMLPEPDTGMDTGDGVDTGE